MNYEPISDLKEMMSKFPQANIEELLVSAYKRGFIDGRNFAGEKIIEAIELIK